METKIQATIVAGVDKNSVNKATKEFARDTKKALDPSLKQNLEINLAKFQQQLDEARARLRKAKKEGDKDAEFQARLRVNALQRDTTEAKRILNNYVNTGTTTLSRLQMKFNQIGQGLVNSFKSLVGPLAIVGLLTTAVRGLFSEFRKAGESARKFEKAMSNVATLVDTSVESIDQMGKELLNIATRVPVSIEELTDALYDVRSAGIGAEDAMSVLEQSARLATAGLGTTKEAVNLVTSAFNTFASQGYNAEVIASSLFLAVKNGKTTISELAQGFGSVASLVQSLNVDFRDFLSATTALTTSGLSASEAYTQVGGILTAIAKQTPQSVRVAKELGFEFSATALEAKGLSGFIEDLGNKLEENGIEGAKTTEILSKLFGRKEALVGVLSLLNSRSQQYADILREMTGESNAFLEAFDKQAKTVDARIIKLTSELEKERIKLGQTTSAWKGLGLFLRIQFIKTLNSVGNTFGALADIAIGSWKIIFQTAKGALVGINKLVTNFFKTGKLDFKSAFNFEGARSEVDKLFNKVKRRFDGSADDTAEAVKQRNDVLEDANKALSEDFDKLAEKAGGTLKGSTEAVEEYQKAVDEMTSTATKSYDELTKSINKSQEAQQKLRDDIADIDTDIAKRIVEIDQKLAEGGLSGQEISKLQKERAKAFEGLSAEQEIEFQKVLDEQKRVSALSDVEKLLELKAQKQQALDEELENEKNLKDELKKLENDFANFLQEKKQQELTIAEQLKQKRLEVARARDKALGGGGSVPGRATGGPVSAGSPYIVGERGPELFVPNNSGRIVPNHQLTVNQNVNANVANGVDIDILANQLAKKITLAGKGVL